MLPSVLHWLVPWRAVMGRDDKRRGELVGWWVALPCSPSSWSLHTFCLPLPLRLFFLIPTATAFPDSLYCFFCVSSFIFFSSAPVRWGAFQRGAGKDGGEEASVRGLAVDWPIITCYNISQSPALFLIVFLSSGFPRPGLTLFWSCSPEKQQPSVSQVALLVFLIQSPASPYFCSCRLSCTPLLTTSSSSDLHRPEKGKWGVLLPPCLSSAVPL